MKNFIISLAIAFVCLVPLFGAGPLEFSTALCRVYSQSHLLSIAELDTQIAQAEEDQTHFYPNPDLDMGVADVLGRGRNRGFSGYVTTIGVSQLVEIGGVRPARQGLAAAETTVAQWEQVIARLDLRYELLKAFIDNVTLQEKLKVAEGQANIAKEVFSAVKSKVESGKVSPIQQQKSEIAYNTALFSTEETKADLEDAQLSLALLWESNSPDFDSVIYPFYAIVPPPSLDELIENLDSIPDLAKSQSEIDALKQNSALQRAERIPPVIVSAGYSEARYSEDTGMSLGFSIPIPVFDQNQANIRAADLAASQARYRHQDKVVELQKKIIQVYKQWTKAYRQAQRIETLLLPQAQETFEMTQEGYKNGKFEFLELLDAQSTYFEVTKQYINVLSECHYNKAQIDRMRGKNTQLN